MDSTQFMRINMFNPDLPDTAGSYARWRDAKLRSMPSSAGELTVEVRDPRALTVVEHAAIVERLERANIAIYASPVRVADKSIPLAFGGQFGLARLDGNWLADEDKVTQITVDTDGSRHHYIPYTNHPMNWHTDGYYNDLSQPIHAMLLHCVRSAARGGENTVFDHEIAYIRMRDHNPDFVRALLATDAMTIPARDDEDGIARAAVSGPVFSKSAVSGRLHMRYTARTRSIVWARDAITQAAVAWLQALLNSETSGRIRARLEPGMGLLCRNVLHNRASYEDDPATPRLLYRARYFDEISCAPIDKAQATQARDACQAR